VNYDGVYQWFNGPHILQFDGRKTVGLYNYQEDKLLKNNLMGRIPKVQEPMELQVKAFIQQYSNRMLDDRLTVPTTSSSPSLKKNSEESNFMEEKPEANIPLT
jgi:hypothetical protein